LLLDGRRDRGRRGNHKRGVYRKKTVDLRSEI
jgi:hypothetical protein